MTLDHILSRDEQASITRRAVRLDLIRIAASHSDAFCDRALALYIRYALNEGISEDEIKQAITEARKEPAE